MILKKWEISQNILLARFFFIIYELWKNYRQTIEGKLSDSIL